MSIGCYTNFTADQLQFGAVSYAPSYDGNLSLVIDWGDGESQRTFHDLNAGESVEFTHAFDYVYGESTIWLYADLTRTDGTDNTTDDPVVHEEFGVRCGHFTDDEQYGSFRADFSLQMAVALPGLLACFLQGG